MSWKLNKKNLAHFAVSPLTATLHAAHRTVGKKFRDKLRLNRKRLMPSPVSSAASYAYNRGEYYGPTGSIVGRY